MQLPMASMLTSPEMIAGAWQAAQDELEERLGRENVTQLESLLLPLWR